LEEYLKERKKPAVELPPPRKPGEGEKNSTWSNYVPLKKEEETLFAAKAETESEKKAKEAANKQTVPANQVLDIKFQEERRGYGRGREGRERGGRDNGGQRRGGNKGRSKQGNQATPNFRDESSFPALSTKA